MALSRRARAKAEGTFLEHVKDTLQILTKEIRHIKSSIDELKTLQCNTGACFTQAWDGIWSQCDQWYPCQAWEPYPTASEEASVHQVMDYFGGGIPGSKEPSQGFKMTRAQLLAYRKTQLGKEVLDEMGFITVPSLATSIEQPTAFDTEVRAAFVIQRYYRRYVKTMTLLDVWLPVEEWRLAVNSQQSIPNITKQFSECGCRDYDTGIWFRIDPEGSSRQHPDSLSESWDEQQYRDWVTTVLQRAENAPTLAGGAQVIARAWMESSRYMTSFVRKEIAPSIFRHLNFFRDRIVQMSSHCVQPTVANGQKRKTELLRNLDSMMSSMLDLVEGVVQGRVSIPAPIKKLIMSTVRETYDWQRNSNLSIVELDARIKHLGAIMKSAEKKAVVLQSAEE